MPIGEVGEKTHIYRGALLTICLITSVITYGNKMWTNRAITSLITYGNKVYTNRVSCYS